MAARLQDNSLYGCHDDSCTGIVYKKKTTKFKIIPICKELITILKGFNKANLNVNYADFDYEEFDSSKVRCNVLQNRKDAKQDPLLLASVNGNKDLLNDCVDYTFDKLREMGGKEGMGFLVRKNPGEDELRALFIYCSSCAVGCDSFNDDSFFLRVAQAAEPHK